MSADAGITDTSVAMRATRASSGGIARCRGRTRARLLPEGVGFEDGPGDLGLGEPGLGCGVAQPVPGIEDVEPLGGREHAGGLVDQVLVLQAGRGRCGVQAGAERQVGVAYRAGGPRAEERGELLVVTSKACAEEAYRFTDPTTRPSSWMGSDRLLATPWAAPARANSCQLRSSTASISATSTVSPSWAASTHGPPSRYCIESMEATISQVATRVRVTP